MYKWILKIFGLTVDLYISMRLVSYAALLGDQSSDSAVLGAIGILLLVTLTNAAIIRALFEPKSKTKQENKNAQ
jgi:hypothetical protein